MAEILNEEHLDESLLDENEELHSFDEVVEEELTEEPVQETPEEEELPEKYRGKSPAEIVRMHQEAEKMLGRQSGEVGELRKIVDDFVKVQLENKTTQSTQVEDTDDEIDWYTDPDKAVQRAINNHPKLKEAEAVSAEMKKAQAMAELQNKHPDFQQIVTDPAFGEWVSCSKVRLQLFPSHDLSPKLEAADCASTRM